jgi:hypothetical protein
VLAVRQVRWPPLDIAAASASLGAGILPHHVVKVEIANRSHAPARLRVALHPTPAAQEAGDRSGVRAFSIRASHATITASARSFVKLPVRFEPPPPAALATLVARLQAHALGDGNDRVTVLPDGRRSVRFEALLVVQEVASDQAETVHLRALLVADAIIA